MLTTTSFTHSLQNLNALAAKAKTSLSDILFRENNDIEKEVLLIHSYLPKLIPSLRKLFHA